MMTATEKIRTVAKRKQINLGELADKSGQSRQNLSNKMARDDLKESEIGVLANILGCDFEVVLIDRETGERI